MDDFLTPPCVIYDNSEDRPRIGFELRSPALEPGFESGCGSE